MSGAAPIPPLPVELADELCRALGVPMPHDLDEVAALYRAWVAQIPFDTVAKAAALAAGEPPPGVDGAAFAARWLATGVGGTCWGHGTAFVGILRHADADASIAVERMRREDAVVDFHSFVVLRDGGERWAMDHVSASAGPLPMADGATSEVGGYRTGFREEGHRLVHWFENPETGETHREYVVLDERLDAGDVWAFCEVSRVFSGVTSRKLYHRRFPDGYLQARPDDEGRLAVTIRRGDEIDRTTFEDLDAGLAHLGYRATAWPLIEQAGFLVRAGDGWRLRTNADS